MTTEEETTMTPRFEIITITPELAAEWLERPVRFPRPVNNLRRAKYMRRIVNGEWSVGWDAICFDVEGWRLNGGHRLSAIVEAGIAVQCLVGFDLPVNAVFSGDGGLSRRVTQYLDGAYKKERVAASRLILWYDAGSVVPPTGRALEFSELQLRQLIDGDLSGTLLRSVSDASAASQLSGVPASVHGAVLTIARRAGADPFKIEGWLMGLRDGVGLGEDDPRRHLIRRMTNTHARMIRRDTVATWMLVVRAFNAWFADRPMRVLKYEQEDTPPRIDLAGHVVESAGAEHDRED